MPDYQAAMRSIDGRSLGGARAILCATVGALLLLPTTEASLADDIRAESRIDEVTVYPAGAEVLRRVKVAVPAGAHRIVVEDLASDARPGSVRVEGRSTGRLDVISIDTRRVTLADTDPATQTQARRALEDELQRLQDARALLDGDMEALEAQRTLYSNMTGLPNQPQPATGAAGAMRSEDWRQLIGLVGTGLAENRKAAQAVTIALRESEREVADVQRQLAALAPKQRQRTRVEINVTAAAALETELALSYQVVSASWAPLYDARLTTGTKTLPAKLTLTRRARVQQQTGEAWTDVGLKLSTVRPRAATVAPTLETTTIDFQQERVLADQPVAMSAPPHPNAAMVRRSVKTAEPTAGIAPEGAVAQLQDVEIAGAQQVDAGAFQALFQLPGRQSVPNTGEPKSLNVAAMEMEPTLTVRAVPRREVRAYLYAKLNLPRTAPYLAGEVALFRDQTFVGTGWLPQLAPGAEHELGFGADDAIRVQYAVLDEKRGETGLISSVSTDSRNYRLAIKSMHERQIAFSLVDHVPVSLNQEIKVELTGRQPPTRRDLENKRGVVAWDDKLAPDEEKVIEFGYKVTWPAAKRVEWR